MEFKVKNIIILLILLIFNNSCIGKDISTYSLDASYPNIDDDLEFNYSKNKKIYNDSTIVKLSKVNNHVFVIKKVRDKTNCFIFDCKDSIVITDDYIYYFSDRYKIILRKKES